MSSVGQCYATTVRRSKDCMRPVALRWESRRTAISVGFRWPTAFFPGVAPSALRRTRILRFRSALRTRDGKRHGSNTSCIRAACKFTVLYARNSFPASESILAAITTERVLKVHHWTECQFTFQTTRDSGRRFENGQFPMVALHVDECKLPNSRNFQISNRVGEAGDYVVEQACVPR